MNKTHLTQTKFSDLDLNANVLAGLDAAGFEYCTPIQALTLPIATTKQDVMGQAQTGTGKTIAFLTATFDFLLKHSQQPNTQPRSVIMAPTRELAIQIFNDAKAMAETTGLRVGLVYGGESYEIQRERLQKGVDILIGTTGRLIDFYKQGAFSLENVEVVVLDEADRMFDLGFIKDIRYILRRCPDRDKRLNLLFSATLSYRVQELAFEHMNEPKLVEVEPEQMTGKRIKEELFYPSMQHKVSLLLTLIEDEWPDKGIIFANTKHGCEDVYSWLAADKHRVGLLTGDVPQKKRVSVLEQFTNGNLDFLVATDVAARGLHIPKVTHVFNYDLPDDAEDYVHRIGRTGRAGESGIAISFACENFVYNLSPIEEYIRHEIPVSHYDETALLSDLTPPIKRRRSTIKRSTNNRRGKGSGKPAPRKR